MAHRGFSPLLVALAGAAGLGGCNLITGASDLEVSGSSGHGGQGGAGTSSAQHGSSSGPTSSGASSSSTAGSTSSSGSSVSSASSSSGGVTCSPACAGHHYCEPATKTCVCDPGYVDQGGTCSAAPPGDPTTHTQQDVELDKLFMDVCVYNARIMGPNHVENVTELACRTALSYRGVSHITIPVDFQDLETVLAAPSSWRFPTSCCF